MEFNADDKLLAEIDLPPEICYVMSYIKIICSCGAGRNSATESRAQAMFPIRQLLKNLFIADFCYPYKSALVLYIKEIYFESANKIEEDFQATIWEIIEIMV